MDTCNNVIQQLIPRVESKLARHKFQYNYASIALPQLYAVIYVKSRSNGRKYKWTCTPFLSANKKNSISAKMKPRALRSKVTSSTLGVGVDYWSHNHRMEIADPLRVSTGGMTPSNSRHNSATSNTCVPMTASPWIRSLRMIVTSYNVIVISSTGA